MDFRTFDIPADLDTPVSAFLKLSPLCPRFLLESVEGGERLGRYSFLGFGDAEEIRLVTPPTSDPLSSPAPAAFLDRLRAALARAPRFVDDEPVALPFAGGLVGAIGYGATRRLERLPASGNGPDALLLAPRSVLVFDHVTRRAALRHAGPAAERAALRKEIVRALHGGIPERRPGGLRAEPVPSVDRPAFLDAVRTAQRAIRDGEVFQIVLSSCFRGPFDGDPFEVYRILRRVNPSPYTFFLKFGDTSLAGSSPEALVKLEGRVASLRPIAGTRPRGAGAAADRTLEDDLLADPKEAAEHVMLVDLARNDLGRVATPGTIRVDPSRIVERYSHVMHLVSGVSGVLRPDADAFDLFASAFPAGTVTGAPKVRAMELIEAIEPQPRGFYAGTVGYFGHGGALDQAITIRTLAFHEGEVSFQAGAGIVAGSVPEREHDEILAKAAIMRAALSLEEAACAPTF
ncbi:MAG TPA: anthranilate synthase component I family protein [Candidatus Polarisedimenticolaceae bacterium]|nr:anthranilate synthase component I family protein [Candidatus Polarisedimenticolaceae bacterium]